MVVKKHSLDKKNGRFVSEWGHHESLFFGTIPSLLQSVLYRPARNKKQALQSLYVPHACPEEKSDVLTLYWLGHASFLLQIGGCTMLLDPVLGEISWLFPRGIPVGVRFEDMPPIDLVLLSHNHPDHADLPSMRLIERRDAPTWLVAQGDKPWMERAGFKRVSQLSWWERIFFEKNEFSRKCQRITCTYLPAAHWSRRGLFDLNRSLWGSWMISCGGYTVYFGGDSSYADHFELIGKEFDCIDVALLPVGPVEPADWMGRAHMSGERVLEAARALKCKTVIPMHWGTFPFGLDSLFLPLERVQKAWRSASASDPQLLTPRIGEKVVFE